MYIKMQIIECAAAHVLSAPNSYVSKLKMESDDNNNFFQSIFFGEKKTVFLHHQQRHHHHQLPSFCSYHFIQNEKMEFLPLVRIFFDK